MIAELRHTLERCEMVGEVRSQSRAVSTASGNARPKAHTQKGTKEHERYAERRYAAPNPLHFRSKVPRTLANDICRYSDPLSLPSFSLTGTRSGLLESATFVSRFKHVGKADLPQPRIFLDAHEFVFSRGEIISPR